MASKIDDQNQTHVVEYDDIDKESVNFMEAEIQMTLLNKCTITQGLENS